MTAVLQRAQVPAQRHTADTPWTLVEQAQAGDMDAWAAIWQANRDRIFRFVWWRVRNRTIAEDLTSEIFTKALDRIGGVDWRGRDIGAWLTTIARNLVADYYKCGPGPRKFPHDDFTDNDQPDPDTPALLAEQAEMRTVLEAALTTLTPEQAVCDRRPAGARRTARVDHRRRRPGGRRGTAPARHRGALRGRPK